MSRAPLVSTPRRVGAQERERGSIAILLMVMLVGLMLGGLLVPAIITQDRTTRFDTTRVQALDAAQSGVDVMLGLIRASVTAGIGDSSKLPCGPQSGVVNISGVAAYSVVVEYFTFDPVNEPYPSSQAMKCVTGYGTYDSASGTTTPGFARFTSTGTAGPATNGATPGRTVTATYTFRTSNVNVIGGQVQIQPSGSATLCMDAGSPTAPAGTRILLQVCSASTPPPSQQVFAYRTDLTLALVSSITTANPNGLCLNSAHAPAVSGDAVQLSQCGPLGSPSPYTQQWTLNENGRYQAAQSSSATDGSLPDLCMNVPTQAAGQPISLSSCSGAPGWIPSPSVGLGAVALPQWINYYEFGRCMDVTGGDPSHTFLIDYPCKQNPFPGAKSWNQLFTAPAVPAGQASVTGQIYTTASGTKYCLTSPGTTGNYVTLQACTSSSAQSWTIYGGDKSVNYSTKYTLVSGSLCLGLQAPDPSLSTWSTIDVETCTGAAEQKWNANPNVLSSTLKNLREK